MYKADKLVAFYQIQKWKPEGLTPKLTEFQDKENGFWKTSEDLIGETEI